MGIFDGIIGGILDFIGGERRNAAQEDAAQKQMDFQAFMSNSAYQRGVDDLKKAGLNPMLAYLKAPASSPAGAMANIENTMGSAVNTALSASVRSETVQNLVEQNRLLQRQQEKTAAEARNTDVDTLLKYSTIPRVDQDVASAMQAQRESEVRTRLLERQIETEVVRGKLTYEQGRKVEEEVRNAVKEGRLIDARVEDVTAAAVLKKLAEFEARNKAAHEVAYAGWSQNVRPFLSDAAKVGGSAFGFAQFMNQFRNRGYNVQHFHRRVR